MVRAAALFLFACHLLPAGPRDYWLKIERNGSPFAWEHIAVTELPGGGYRYDYSHEIRVGTEGAVDLHEKSSFVVDRELRPVSVTSWRRDKKGEFSTRGERAGNVMTVTERAQDGATRRFTFDVRKAYFGCVQSDLIVRNPRRRRLRFRTVDLEEQKVETTSIEIRGASGETIEAAVRRPEWTMVYRLSRDGRVQELRADRIGLRGYPADPADARRIASLKDSLFPPVKSRNPFPNPFTVTRARVQVKWHDLPASALRLEDNRQTLLRSARAGEASEAVVELGARPRLAAKASSRRPGAADLGQDRYVASRSPAIRKQAAEIVGGTKDRNAMVHALLKWVNGYIRYEIQPSLLTAQEILEKRKGRCSEYAILFASLARAAGIPTRLSLGVTYHDGVWEGHMWNEVWLGKWTAVDATTGGAVDGPLDLKLIDSATVDGVLVVPKRILDGLQVEILDFDEKGVHPTLQTGISGTTYSNARFRCRIAAPDNSWELTEQAEADGSRLLSMKPRQGGEGFALRLAGVASGTTAEAAMDALLQEVSHLPGFGKSERESVEVARRKAPSVTYSHRDEDGRGMRSRNVILVDGNCAYLFVWTGRSEETGPGGDAFRRILESFELYP